MSADPQSKIRAQLSPKDIAFLDAMHWREDAAPKIESQEQAAFIATLEHKLRKSIESLSYSERGGSLEGQLAAALGARLADWGERGEVEED